ncbi:MAG: hypothetical protein RBT03_01855 [Kiritimatiellia bacterium]|nr:hypothetical protein [Kiritimatiellia bacterium]
MKKTKLGLLLLAALLGGFCLGFYANATLIRTRIQRYSQVPANMPELITNRLTKRLDLNADQRRDVLKIFQAHGVRMKDARAQNRALLDSLIEEARVEIAQHLTPEQQAEHKKLLAELRKRYEATRTLRRALAHPPKHAHDSSPPAPASSPK